MPARSLKIAWGCCFLFWAVAGYAQTTEHDPDRLYTDFARAYRDKDADQIDRLYTTEAVLLNLYDSSSPSSVRGNAEIAKFFGRMFERIEKNGQRLQLAFKIVDRKKMGSTILDNGFYILTVQGKDSVSSISYGKLAAVLNLDKEGWKFAVDANSNTDEQEFRQAQGMEIP